MQTSFTPDQLARPEIARADAILKTCVHYGFCTAGCPTYVLTRDENDSPRGRIDLIRAMLESDAPPAAKTVHHLDRCLSCFACMTTCAVAVDYMHLSDIARSHIERHYRRPPGDRLLRHLLAGVLPRPALFRAAAVLGRVVRPFARALPGRLRTLVDMLPAHAPASPLAARVVPAEGARRMRVGLLAGCVQQALAPAINAATIRLLARHGCEVVVAGPQCCGALTLHMGREDEAKAAARASIAAWIAERDARGLDAIVVNASGCGTTVKDYGRMFADDPAWRAPAEAVARLALDVTELMQRLAFAPTQAVRGRAAYHDPCSMQHAQKVTQPPRALLAAAGLTVLDVPERHFCCGSAGTYNLLQPAMADELGRRKAAHIASTDPDLIATGNIGCMVQIGRHSGLPVVHTVELLDWASGGPRPPALAAAVLRAPPAGSAAAQPSADPGIW